MSRRTVKPLVSLIGLIAVCGVLIAGCGDSGDSTTADTASGENHEPVTLTLGWWYENAGAWKTLVDGFEEKYPWITVKQDVVPYQNYYAKLGAWTTASSGPDVFVVETGALWEPYIDSLQPLGDVEDLTSQTPNPEVFCPRKDCSKGTYGVGFTQIGYPLYYNRSILEAAGLDPDDPPSTISEMSDACEKIEASGKACWAIGGKDLSLPLISAQMVLNTASSEQMLELGEGKAHWTDPEFVALLQTMEYIGEQDWYQEGFTSMSIGSEPESLFVSGKSAFIQGLIGDGLQWRGLGEAIGFDNIGIVSMPALDPGAIPGAKPGPLNETMGAALSSAFAVPVWSKHEEEAKLLMAYALEPRVQKAMIEQQNGPFPALASVEASWADEPFFGEVLDLVNTAESSPLLQYIGWAYLETWNAELQKLSLGETSPEAAAAALDKAATATLTKAG